MTVGVAVVVALAPKVGVGVIGEEELEVAEDMVDDGGALFE